MKKYISGCAVCLIILTGCASTKTAKLEKLLRQQIAGEADKFLEQKKHYYVDILCEGANEAYEQLRVGMKDWIIK